MSSVRILPAGSMGKDFIPDEYLPAGSEGSAKKDQYYLRNRQQPAGKSWRKLKPPEITLLEANDNRSDNWENVLVTDPFIPALVKNNRFFGLVRIGRIDDAVLEFHDLKLPTGICNSLIVSTDIGDNCAIHNVSYLAHYILGDKVILFNIDEMHTTNYAKFGNGIVKDGEDESVRIRLDVLNESGGRSILPFDGIIPADALLWARYRGNKKLQQKLQEITQNSFDSRRGFYGTIGSQTVIKNSRILKDVKTGEFCYIKGANKLKNLTINSSEQEHTQIGEGVELVNGIIGYGCKIFYGCKAVRFIMNDNASLKYGARLIHSFLGANSTVSCCEVLNNLIFPAHEQHHNNSFLIAALVMGQSNMAAGATIGSNHNSRANDNEVIAGRGFWPGLCSSIKHSSVFASYVLLAKGSYPAEMHIPFPFALVNNNVHEDRLEIIPAFWWMFNMYALIRNSAKFKTRDKRERRAQHVEFDMLAPDTAEEIIAALSLLEKSGQTDRNSPVFLDNLEKSKRKVTILKAGEAREAYRDMLLYYAITNIISWCKTNPGAGLKELSSKLEAPEVDTWINLGGQLVPAECVEQLIADITDGKLASWQAIHSRYDELWQAYPLQKQQHSWKVLKFLAEGDVVTADVMKASLDRFLEIRDFITERVRASREKDFENPFKQATFFDKDEMNAVCGTIENNELILETERKTAELQTELKALKKQLGL